MGSGGGNEVFDLTRRRGDAEEDAEKKVERRRGLQAFRVRLAEAAEKTEVRRPSFARTDRPGGLSYNAPTQNVGGFPERTPSRMGSGGGNEVFDLTRRRGDAEEDAEKKVERRRGIQAFRVRLAEAAEKTEVRRPSFARTDRPGGLSYNAPTQNVGGFPERTPSRMEGGGGNEVFDLTRRRGDAEEDAEKEVERRREIQAFRVRLAEAAEKTEVRRPSFARTDRPGGLSYNTPTQNVGGFPERTPSRMEGGVGNEVFDLTRRRGDAEEDAEKKVERRRDSGVPRAVSGGSG